MISPAILKVYNMFTWVNDDNKQKVDVILKVTVSCRQMSLGKDMCSIQAISMMMKS